MKLAKTYIFLLLILIATLGNEHAFSQTISAQVDREKIMIGEKILLTVKVEDVKPQSGIIQWIDLPDTINHFEVIERGKIDTIKVDGIINYQQVINITSFDSGRWEIPSLSVQVSSATSPLSTSPITIDVIPVDVSQLKDYHDIKEIVEVKDEKSKLIIILLIIVTLIALALVIWLSRRKRNAIIEAPQPQGSLEPLDWALAELNKLQQENLPSKGLVKQFYQRMTDISRQYFYRQLKHSALHQTSDEWMFSLQDMPVDNQTKTSFFQFIRLADTVKFAKYLPPAEEHDHSLNTAANMFKSVADLRFANLANNIQR
ncbi:MAG TPA: hypothetical protein VF622_09110 [Segetibacter sp.]